MPSVDISSHTSTSMKMKEGRIKDFDLLKVLGKGAYGKVFQARKVRGSHQGQVFAIKSVNKDRIASSQTDIRHTKAERDVLVKTEHPFIVKMYYAFETNKRLYLVQEFCRGGELFRRMEVERMMLEDHARFYLSEIVCALEYLHSLNIVYRDLKTENVMLCETGHVKLIDFGLSKLGMGEGVLTNTFCGTGKPEWLRNSHHYCLCYWKIGQRVNTWFLMNPNEFYCQWSWSTAAAASPALCAVIVPQSDEIPSL